MSSFGVISAGGPEMAGARTSRRDVIRLIWPARALGTRWRAEGMAERMWRVAATWQLARDEYIEVRLGLGSHHTHPTSPLPTFTNTTYHFHNVGHGQAISR